MMINREEWNAIEMELKNSVFTSIEFKYQEHTITVQKHFTAENKTNLCVYLDNEIKGKWLFVEKGNENYNPLTEVFWKRREKGVYNPKHKKDIIKAFGKRKARKVFPDLDEKRAFYTPYFSKASPLVRQFKKIKGLELTSRGKESIETRLRQLQEHKELKEAA